MVTRAPDGVTSVLVTGAGRGIGRAIALDLASSSKTSLLLVSRSSNCEETARLCNELRPGSARPIVWDISQKAAAADEVLSYIESAPGPLGLVHAAGTLGPTGPFWENSLDAWWKAFDVNFVATIKLVHSVLPRMIRERAGRIALFAGGGAAYGYPGFSSYGSAKVAIVRFVETLAMELEDRGPIVTVIAPGANDTDMLAEVRKAGGIVKTVVGLDEPCRLIHRLMTEDTRGLHGRFVHVRDTWDGPSASAFSTDRWKLRRVE